MLQPDLVKDLVPSLVGLVLEELFSHVLHCDCLHCAEDCRKVLGL